MAGATLTRLFSLQQGLAIDEMGFGGQFARQQSQAGHVRFGSKADIAAHFCNVRFTSKSGHCRVRVRCPLSARSGNSTVQSSCPFPQSGHREFYSALSWADGCIKPVNNVSINFCHLPLAKSPLCMHRSYPRNGLSCRFRYGHPQA
jgi:hypothetical protein